MPDTGRSAATPFLRRHQISAGHRGFWMRGSRILDGFMRAFWLVDGSRRWNSVLRDDRVVARCWRLRTATRREAGNLKGEMREVVDAAMVAPWRYTGGHAC